MDFRRRAVAYKDEGHTFEELREAFGIPAETYYRRKRKLRNGYREIKTVRERRRKTGKEGLKQAAAGKPDAYPRELAEKFDRTGSAVFYALEWLKITRKKTVLPSAKNPKRNVGNIPPG